MTNIETANGGEKRQDSGRTFTIALGIQSFLLSAPYFKMIDKEHFPAQEIIMVALSVQND